MTPEAQRIAIAEACGWDLAELRRKWQLEKNDYDFFKVPDYLNDLNAMHEAEKVLDGSQILPYIVLLQPHWHPTAAQRAEAFLRTLGLWKD